MVIPVIQLLYYLTMLFMLFMGIFIVFHIVSFSYSNFSRILMLAIFVPVAGILMLTNLMLFSSIDFMSLLGNIM